MSENLAIGACDWRHKHWSGAFYPEELPSDWCLGFYSNEFETVLVPSGQWQDETGYGCEGWLDEINETFRFYVELPPELAAGETGRERFIRDMNLLEDALGGIVVTTGNGSHVWLGDALPEIPVLLPVTAAEGYECYRDDHRGAAMIRLYHDLVDKRAARGLLEQALQGGCENAQICIVDADALRASDLSLMRQVIELMGL